MSKIRVIKAKDKQSIETGGKRAQTESIKPQDVNLNWFDTAKANIAKAKANDLNIRLLNFGV